MKNNIKETA